MYYLVLTKKLVSNAQEQTSQPTLLRLDEANTKEAVPKALTNKSKIIKHSSKLTIITLKERLNCYCKD
jgi:hypothetical protein